MSVNIAIENGDLVRGFSREQHGWIFHSYVNVYQRVIPLRMIFNSRLVYKSAHCSFVIESRKTFDALDHRTTVQMAQIASSMINPYENVMVRYGEIFQFAACWSLPEGMRTLIGSYSYLRCASQELLMYAINIGNTQHTVGNETQSN